MSKRSEINNGAVDFVMHFRVTKDNNSWRVVNTKNGIINKHIFLTRDDAMKHAKCLARWHRGNSSENGKVRTARANEKFVASYHANKNKERT